MNSNHLSKEQCMLLEKRLQEWRNILAKIAVYEENRPPFEISIMEGFDKNSLSFKIQNKRPPTQFGGKQGAHTFAYSAVLKSLNNTFKDLDAQKVVALLYRFHRELHVTYITSITTNSIQLNGRHPVFGKLNLHEFKDLCDQIVLEILKQEEKNFLTTVPGMIKLYLTSYLYMHNRLIDATADQKSIGRGEAAALEGLENLEKFGGAGTYSKNEAVKYLSWLIDEEAIEAILKSKQSAIESLIGFQILGIYRLISGYPKLSQLLSITELFSQSAASNENLIFMLSSAIFCKFDKEGKPARHIEIEYKHMVKKSLAWLYDTYRCTSPYGVLNSLQ